MSVVLSRSVEICNKKGLHARASAAFARLALQYDARIKVTHEDMSADAASIMDLLMLTAHKGCVVEVSAEGAEADAALSAAVDLIENRFGEDE